MVFDKAEVVKVMRGLSKVNIFEQSLTFLLEKVENSEAALNCVGRKNRSPGHQLGEFKSSSRTGTVLAIWHRDRAELGK
jgi:hypothetical protein